MPAPEESTGFPRCSHPATRSRPTPDGMHAAGGGDDPGVAEPRGLLIFQEEGFSPRTRHPLLCGVGVDEQGVLTCFPDSLVFPWHPLHYAQK